MADNETRRARLRWLLTNEFDDYRTGFAKHLSTSTSQLGQWLSGHRGIGDASARRIEAVCKKSRYWLDGEGKAEAKELSPMAVRLARAFDRIASEQIQYEQFAKLTQQIEDAANAPAPGATAPGRAPMRRRVPR